MSGQARGYGLNCRVRSDITPESIRTSVLNYCRASSDSLQRVIDSGTLYVNGEQVTTRDRFNELERASRTMDFSFGDQ